MTGTQSLKEMIKEKKNFLKANCLNQSGKSKDLICLIKLMPGSRYEQMVKVLDEVVSDSVPIYAIQGYSDDELHAVKQEQQKLAMK